MSQDTFSTSGGQEVPAAAPVHRSVDRLELKPQWARQEDEEQAEEAVNLYARAARQRMRGGTQEIPDSAGSDEEREIKSQQLKLRQKCQDIAALIMVDEMEELEEEE